MRKIIISLVLLFSTSLAFGQKYQGDANISLQVLGLSISSSHGILLNNSYIGGGVEAGVGTTFFDARDWAAVYADYRQLINIGSKGNSLFIQLAPGFTHTSNDGLLNAIFGKKDEKGEKPAERSNCFYAKIGAGFQWNSGLSLGLYCTYFGDNFNLSIRRFYPSVGLTFHW